MAAAARGPRRVRLALDEHVDQARALGRGQLAVDGEPRPSQGLADSGGVDGVLHDGVRHDEIARRAG